MAYSSISSTSSTNSEVSNDSNCCSSCLECVKDLKEQNEQLVKDLRIARISVVSYKTGLESVEARLLVFKKNESVYEEDIKLLKREIYLRDLDIIELKRKLELATEEKDEEFYATKNLVYPSLDDFVDVNESVSESVFEKPTVETNKPDTSRKEKGAPIIEDWVFDSDEENVPKVNIVKGTRVNTARPKAVLSAVKENKGNVVKASACWDNPQQDLKDKGVIDSGCSRHMTGNRSYLTTYEEIDGGFVIFRDNSKGGKITGKVPRKDNMYSVDLKNVVPQGGLTCLFAKATPDESNLWHRRLGYVNFKTMNKLVRGNLVRGLPSKVFEINQTCVACQKGKQHKASCKTKTVSSISQPLQMLHMDWFGPAFVKSLMKKVYCLVVTDDFYLKVKVIRCDNGTEFKNRVMNQFCEMKGIKREFSVARTPQQNGAEAVNTACYVQNRVSVIKPHNKTPYELFLGSGPNWLFDIDALTNSMNYKPIVAGNQSNGNAGTKACDDTCKARIETDSLDVGFKPSGEEEKKEAKDLGNEIGNQTKGKDNEVPSTEEPKINQEKDDYINSTNNINTTSDGNNTNNFNVVSSTVNADVTKVNAIDLKTRIELPNDPNMPELEDIIYSNDDEDVGTKADMNNLDAFMPVSPITTTRIHKDHPVDQIIGDLNSTPQTRRMTKNLKEHGLFSSVQQRTNHKDFQNCLFACFLSQEVPKKVIQALKDPSCIEAMQDELLQFKLQMVWTLVDLPNGKRAIGTKWIYRNKMDERGIVIKNKARLVAQGYTQEEGIDYDEVFAHVSKIEAIRLFLAYTSFKDFVVYKMDVKSAFLYGKIEEEVYVCQSPGFEDSDFPDRVYKVEKALYGLHQAPRAWYETFSTYLLENGFQRGQVDKTLFIKRDQGDILIVQFYVDDIIFGSTKKKLCT
ncbi:putative ribonuclease H-like domain-containing protein [Tanacetum coccineum]